MSHFVVEVNIKETIDPKPVMNDNGYPVKALGGADLMSERRVIDRVRVVVSDDNEKSAVQRAIAMLQTQMSSESQHLHRASCHGPIGELQCGFPPGPTI